MGDGAAPSSEEPVSGLVLVPMVPFTLLTGLLMKHTPALPSRRRRLFRWSRVANPRLSRTRRRVSDGVFSAASSNAAISQTGLLALAHTSALARRLF